MVVDECECWDKEVGLECVGERLRSVRKEGAGMPGERSEG